MGGKRVRESDSSGRVRLVLREMSASRTEDTSPRIRSISDGDGAISPKRMKRDRREGSSCNRDKAWFNICLISLLLSRSEMTARSIFSYRSGSECGVRRIIRLVRADSLADSCIVIVLTWIPVFISDGLNVAANPRRLDDRQEARDAWQRVGELESAEQSWGGDAAERAGDGAQIEELFAVELAPQPTLAPQVQIQVFDVEIEGEQVDDRVDDVDGENWRYFWFGGYRHECYSVGGSDWDSEGRARGSSFQGWI